MNDRDRYEKACHAMQTGVAFTMQKEPDETTPKHLRVGVNSAMVEHAALVRVLIAKGIVSDSEYRKALADAMEEEVERYRSRVSRLHGGANIELH